MRCALRATPRSQLHGAVQRVNCVPSGPDFEAAGGSVVRCYLCFEGIESL